MAQLERYMNAYKEYETLIRASGRDPKDVEDESPEVEAKRLYMCRQFRNYMAHVPDPGFIVPTDKMLKFLQGRIDALKSQGDTAKKHMKKTEICILKESEKIEDALEKFQKIKRDVILVQGSSGWSLLSVYDLLGMKPSVKISVFKRKSVTPHFCAPLDSYATLDFSKPVLCTDDGTKDGKLLGQVFEG